MKSIIAMTILIFRKNFFTIIILLLLIKFGYSQEVSHTNQYQEVLNNATQNGVPSITAMVKSANGKTWFGMAGVKSIENNQALELNESYRIASVTKLFTAVVVLQLVDEEKLNLEDKISGFLDKDIQSRIPNIENITILHLLSHSSGIYSFTENNNFWKEAFFKEGLSRTWRPTELINYIENKKPVNQPVEPFGEFFYSNSNYILLGMIIEKVTKNTLSFEYNRRIVEILKMNDTFLEGYDHKGRLPINTYAVPKWGFLKSARSKFKLKDVREDKLINISDKYPLFNSWAWAAGGISSSINDLSSFLFALKKGVLLSETNQKVFSKLYTSKDNKTTFFGGTGGSEGIQATMLHILPQDIDIVILINSSAHDKKVSLGSVFKKLVNIASQN